MILVDTSIWIDHFRRGDGRLKSLLEDGQVLTHPFVIGELALGNLKNRKAILGMLADLSGSVIASDMEILDFIEKNSLSGLGIGYLDAHLLAAARLMNVPLWTRDKRLNLAAKAVGLPDSIH